MKISLLKKQPLEKAIELINEDLKVLGLNDLTTASFGKVEEIEGLKINCSWSSIHKYYGEKGYRINRNTYIYEKGELDVHNKLTEEEILFIKELFNKKNKGEVEEKNTLEITIKEEEKTTTGVSMYINTKKRFDKFKKKSAYSGTDILDKAIMEFLEKYDT